MRKRKIETAELLLCCMVLLLGLMAACLLQLHHDVKALEQEIQAVEQRAMEREMHLTSAKKPGPPSQTSEAFVMGRGDRTERTSRDAGAAARDVESLSTKTAAVAPVLCAAEEEEEPVVHETETAACPWPDSDTDYVLRVLTAEAGTDEVLCSCVAQALYNACERYGWAYSPAEMMVKYRYTDPASWVSAEAEKAWDEVFMSGVTWDCVGKATVFYAPRYGESAYHESQRFVTEINGVRFFEEVRG